MHCGFTLDLSDIDLWNIDLLDTHLDLLDADITSKHFCLQDVLKTSSSYAFKTPSRHVFQTSSRHVFKTYWRRLQHNNFSSSKTSWGRLENIFKTSSRRLERRKTVTLKACWRRLQDVSKTSKSLLCEASQKHLSQVFLVFQKSVTKMISCDFCRLIIISDKIDLGPPETLKKWNVLWKHCIDINQSSLPSEILASQGLPKLNSKWFTTFSNFFRLIKQPVVTINSANSLLKHRNLGEVTKKAA